MQHGSDFRKRVRNTVLLATSAEEGRYGEHAGSKAKSFKSSGCSLYQLEEQACQLIWWSIRHCVAKADNQE